jgi:regulator of replication initiation timing
MLEPHDAMSRKDCRAIYGRHGLTLDDSEHWIATVLGGLEAEIAALQAENAKLRAENKKLRLALADGTLFESDSHIDSMIADATK